MQTLSGFHFVKARLYAFTTEKRLKYLITIKGKKQEKATEFSSKLTVCFNFPVFLRLFICRKIRG